MIFETLWQSAQRDELLLTCGGMCHFHCRKDGQLTIREIIVLPGMQEMGIGTEFLQLLKVLGHRFRMTSIFAKCPIELDANGWYDRRGFTLEGQETTKTGRTLNLWRLKL